MSNKKDYKPMNGVDARKILNELGYDVQSNDDPWVATMGMLVALARELEELKKTQNVVIQGPPIGGPAGMESSTT